MPAYLPWHEALVYLSGVLEMAFGALLFVRPIARPAAWGVLVLMIAVFPANVQMALHTELYPQFSPVMLWLRLPFQLLLLAWAYWLTRPDAPHEPSTAARPLVLAGERMQRSR